MIVAIDQSSTCCGWAVFTNDGIRIASGQVTPDKTTKEEKRLATFKRCKQLANATFKQIHGAIIGYYGGGRSAINYQLLMEEISNFNQKSGNTVFALGTITALLMNEAIGMTNIIFTPPTKIKSKICGHGGAEKSDIINAVTYQLNLDYLPKDDEADALAHGLAFTKGLLS